MKKIMIGILFLSHMSYGDILYITIMKDGNKVEVHRIEKNDAETIKKSESTSWTTLQTNRKIINTIIGGFWLTKNDIIYKYNHFEVLNDSEIKNDYIVSGNKIKIFTKDNELIERFKIRAKPDRPKYYWREIEKKYNTYSLPDLKKILTSKEYQKVLKRLEY